MCCVLVSANFMTDETRHYLSPNFTHEKLEPPFYKDVVDVFEDRMLNWLLLPAKDLLKLRHGSVAAVALATNYILVEGGLQLPVSEVGAEVVPSFVGHKIGADQHATRAAKRNPAVPWLRRATYRPAYLGRRGSSAGTQRN